MKVGTDSVLLGAWTKVERAKHILDIGTGNGTIALMLAQRSGANATIDAVEIENVDALQAAENFVQSPWRSKIHLYHTAIQNFFPNKRYDLIISNPPYFNNSQRPPDEKRQRARHTICLTYDDLIKSVVRLLDEQGTFNLVLPFVEGSQFISHALLARLYCSRQYAFKTRSEKPIERLLLEFRRNEQPIETGEIVLYKTGSEWSEEYTNLTHDFYLKI